MIHSFDVGIATEHGVECAIMLSNIEFWVAKNKANRKNFHKGRYWTYNSVKAWAELFPYWSSDKVRRVLEKLEASGLILSDNFNTSTYDRTKWYTVANLNSQIELANLPNGNGEVAKSITDSKPDSNQNTPLPPKGDGLQGFEKFWEQWPKTKRKGGKSQCLAKWKREGYEAIADQIIKHMLAMKQSPDWLKQDGEFVPMPSTYLNQKRWEGSEIAGTTQPEAEFEFWTVAGFATKYDATNNSCYLHNYQEFENGKRCHRKLTEQDLDQIRRGMRVLDKPHEYDLPADIKRMYKL